MGIFVSSTDTHPVAVICFRSVICKTAVASVVMLSYIIIQNETYGINVANSIVENLNARMHIPGDKRRYIEGSSKIV